MRVDSASADPSLLVTQDGSGSALEIRSSGRALLVGAADQGTEATLFSGVAGRKVAIYHGSEGAPTVTNQPTLKVNRKEVITQAQIGASDGSDQVAAIMGISDGQSASETQSVGVLGAAVQRGSIGAGSADACGVYGVGAKPAGTGTGIGAYFEGRRTVDTARANGLEVRVYNGTTTDGTFNTSGFSDTTGIWIAVNGSGTSKAGVGISFGNPYSHKFDVGIGFTSQNGGGVATTSIQDESSSTNSILIKGTHTVGLAIAAGAGYGVVGATARVSASALFEVVGPASFVDPLVQFGQVSSAQGYSVRLRNSSGSSIWFVAGSTNHFATGSAAGDNGIVLGTSGTKILLGASGASPALAVKNNASVSELGFFGVTTAAKQTVTGAKGSNAALGSLLTALANYGLITDSTTA